MMDVLVGKIENGAESIDIYLRTVRGRRVVCFETIVGGQLSTDPGTKIGVELLGKLQPLIVRAVVRAEDEQRGARW